MAPRMQSIARDAKAWSGRKHKLLCLLVDKWMLGVLRWRTYTNLPTNVPRRMIVNNTVAPRRWRAMRWPTVERWAADGMHEDDNNRIIAWLKSREGCQTRPGKSQKQRNDRRTPETRRTTAWRTRNNTLRPNTVILLRCGSQRAFSSGMKPAAVEFAWLHTLLSALVLSWKAGRQA